MGTQMGLNKGSARPRPSGREGHGTDRQLTSALRAVRRWGEPALVVDCGRGNLLLQLRALGCEADGAEPSLERLLACREQALARGVAVDLYCQRMQDLDLPRRYRTIVVAGGAFLRLVERSEAIEALVRFRKHLIAGGALVLILTPPSGPPSVADLPEAELEGQALPQAATVETVLAEERHLLSDPLEQVITTERRYRWCVGHEVVYEQTRSTEHRWYGKHELQMMLAWAGFQDTEVKPLDPVVGSDHGWRGQTPMLVAARTRPASRRGSNA